MHDRWGDAIAVVDYDGANEVYYRPVDLDDPRVLIRGGVDPSEANPRFHQQMLYAVVTATIQHFETALGRRIHWRRGHRQDNPDGAHLEDIWTLNLFPHGFIGANAFYSPAAHGILFGYFRAAAEDVGRNLPGQTIFTCLSHDIVVHETTHQSLTGSALSLESRPIRMYPRSTKPSPISLRFSGISRTARSCATRSSGPAALFTSTSSNPIIAVAREDRYADDTDRGPVISSQLSQRNPLVELAQQFGGATGKQRALRSALGTKPNSHDLDKFTEPHLRGSILVAAVFGAFFAIYQKRTADLWRIYRAGGGREDPVDVPRPLADRLCEAAVRQGGHRSHLPAGRSSGTL